MTLSIASDTPKSGVVAEKLLTRARMQLIANHPFFGSIALRLPLVESDMVPTTAVTNTGVFLWNRKFVNTLDLPGAVSVVAHEVMHIVQAFWARKPKNANHQIWNIACDQVINTALIQAGITSTVLESLCPPNIQSLVVRDKISEVRYMNLLKEMKDNTSCPACKEILDKLSKGQEQNNSSTSQQGKDQNQNGNNKDKTGKGDQPGQENGGHSHGEGEPCNHSGQNGGGNSPTQHTCGNNTFCYGCGISVSEEDADSDTHNYKMMILEARQESMDRGKSPGGMLEEWLESLLKPKVDWKQYIRVAASTEFKNRYTYRRHSRRGPALNLRLPGRQPDNKSAAVFIDTSGSIGKEMLRRFLSECAGILEACGCESIWVGLHDTVVYSFNKLDKKGITSVEVRAGGTSHLDCFKIVEGEHSKYKITDKVSMVICLTDLYSEFPTSCSQNVIWAHPNPEGVSVEVPFGTKVFVETEDDA